MAKGSVRKKGKKWYGRYYIEDESGRKVQKEFVGTESKSETFDCLKDNCVLELIEKTLYIYQFDYSLDSSHVLPDQEIVSVELYVPINNEDVWVDLRDMIKYDIYKSYTLHSHKTFYNEDLGGTYIAIVEFVGSPNFIANYATYGRVRQIRVTVYDDGDA